MYEDIMTPGTAVTAPSGHQPPPTTWLQIHQHWLERTQESIKWSGLFLDPVGSLVSTLWVVVVGCCCWSHFSKLVNFECVGMLKCVGVLECVRVLEC